MAFMRCPECDREVSKTARACPGCGREFYVLSRLQYLAVGLGLFLLMLLLQYLYG